MCIVLWCYLNTWDITEVEFRSETVMIPSNTPRNRELDDPYVSYVLYTLRKPLHGIWDLLLPVMLPFSHTDLHIYKTFSLHVLAYHVNVPVLCVIACCVDDSSCEYCC
jgi:hypothetical protein